MKNMLTFVFVSVLNQNSVQFSQKRYESREKSNKYSMRITDQAYSVIGSVGQDIMYSSD